MRFDGIIEANLAEFGEYPIFGVDGRRADELIAADGVIVPNLYLNFAVGGKHKIFDNLDVEFRLATVLNITIFKANLFIPHVDDDEWV